MKAPVAVVGVAAGMLLAGGGAAQAEGCLYQDDVLTAANQGQVERSLLCLTNAVRGRNGLNYLTADPRLGSAARGHSADMVARGYFSHTAPEGLDPGDRSQAAGYGPFVGENLAASSQGTAISVFRLWRASPGHNANLLGNYVATGLGAAVGFPSGGRGITATQMFGRSPAQGSDTGLDLYYGNEGCLAARQRAAVAKAKLRKARDGSRAKLRRKLRRANRAATSACAQGPTPPLL